MTDFVKIEDLNDALATFFTGTTGVQRVQGHSGLTEGMQDWPTLQIYPEEFEYDVATANDRTTFKAGIRQTEFLFNLDLYGRQRSQLAEDMQAMVVALDAVRARLDTAKTRPFFGMAEIKAYTVGRARRVLFEYGDPAIRYTGFRIPLALRVF